MTRFRFRIGSLLLLIVFLGVGFAALREANPLWDGIVLALTIGVLLVSVLLAIHRRDSQRAFWVGLTLFGWGYMALTAVPAIESRLLTTRGLAYLDSKVPGRPTVITGQAWGGPANNVGQTVASVAFSPQGNVLATSNNASWSSGPIRLWSTTTGTLVWTGGGTTENFVRIGHSLVALILAWLGGKLSGRLQVRNRERRPESDSP